MKKFLACMALGLILTACGAVNNAAPPTAWRVTSPAFAEGAAIPAKYTCSAENVSPPLQWSGAPAETKSFALILEDPDAPGGTFTHWVAFDIPASQNKTAEGANAVGIGGANSFGTPGYAGPCPPSGEHRYIFTLYALDVNSLNLPADSDKARVAAAMQGHILAQAGLMGKYKK